jgi:hypothetical protein
MNWITSLKTSMFILLKTGTVMSSFAYHFWNYLLVKFVLTFRWPAVLFQRRSERNTIKDRTKQQHAWF